MFAVCAPPAIQILFPNFRILAKGISDPERGSVLRSWPGFLGLWFPFSFTCFPLFLFLSFSYPPNPDHCIALRCVALYCFWLFLVAPGCFWLLLVASGCSLLFWPVLACSGLCVAASGVRRFAKAFWHARLWV